MKNVTERRYKMNAYIQTPQGDFDYVVTDFSKGSSCSGCIFESNLMCPFIESEGKVEFLCRQFDTDRTKYHFRAHYEIGGVS